MNCMSLIGSSGRATQCASSSTAYALDDDEDSIAQFSRPTRTIGAPLIMEAASKVDKCLARLLSLQGTVTNPTAPASASASACMSPNFGRPRSCLQRSPRVQEADKIRIHDVLRWSDHFSENFKQERRDKYLRRLSRSKTEVFNDKKDPLDPHGEWKHWSSPAGDVHKVISEILMASQIAKQITSMMNAALVQADVSADDERTSLSRPARDIAASLDLRTTRRVQNRRKEDPLHKFRVVVATHGPVKRRSNAGNRKEVLYPKSKQPKPDRFRPADEIQLISSTAKKMQSRRSPRVAVADWRPQAETWAAKEITNLKSPHRATPSQEPKMLFREKEAQVPSNLRRVRSPKSPTRTLGEKPEMGTSRVVAPFFIVKLIHGSAEPRVGTSSTTDTAVPSRTTMKPNPRALPVDPAVLSSPTKETAIQVVTATGLPFPSAAVTDILTFNPSCEVSVEAAIEGRNVASSSDPVLASSVSQSCSGASSTPQRQPHFDCYQSVLRSQPLIGSLRHKFVMEATEIMGPNKPWRLTQAKSRKAVLFTNPAFAPASPPGARPAQEKRPHSTPATCSTRSSSATRRVTSRIRRALSAGRRSISPDMTQRLSATRQKLISIAPAKSLPSLISRLPSRVKSSSAPRASTLKTPSCTKPAPRMTDHADGGLSAAASHCSSYTKGQLKDMDCNAQFRPNRRTDIAPKKKGNHVKCHSASEWEDEIGVIGVLSTCRRWVAKSAPPLPGGVCRYEQNKESASGRSHKENAIPNPWDDEVGVIGFLSSCRGGAEETVVPGIVGSVNPGVLQRSWSAGAGSRSLFSSGKLPPGHCSHSLPIS